MKLVILDGYSLNPGDLSWEGFRKFGEVEIYDKTNKEDLSSRIGDAQAIFVGSSKITSEIIDKSENLRYIGTLSTGYNGVDVEYANRKGVIVCNVPTYGTRAVAQHAIALLLEITNSVASQHMQVCRGEWSKKGYWSFIKYPMIELENKIMGIIGYGRIGKSTGAIAQALGMKVLANKRTPGDEEETRNFKYASVDEIYEKSDVIVLHCPLNKDNYHMINKDSISKMKDGVIIINNSRGRLIKEEDLIEGLKDGKIYAVGLDVTEREPIDDEHELLKTDRVFITPHSSWAPLETRQRLLDIAVENFEKFIQGMPQNVVVK
ncbi:MAG: D-2-hydroxyacid dehydrogenase [Tissierellia bacterium]|nr:D-2-hydroxyacid dehydrogenase [Tissierellia bacterium]